MPPAAPPGRPAPGGRASPDAAALERSVVSLDPTVRSWLTRELPHLRDEGLLSADQAERIGHRYGIPSLAQAAATGARATGAVTPGDGAPPGGALPRTAQGRPPSGPASGPALAPFLSEHAIGRIRDDQVERDVDIAIAVGLGVILLHHRLDFSQACVRTENDFCERAWVAVRGLYFPLRALPVRVRPPENPLEIREARLHFCERGTTQVEKYIGIPPRDFRGPLIFGIAAVRAQHGDFRKSPGNFFQVNRPHAAGSHVFWLIKFSSQHDAGMEKNDPAIAVGQFVHREIRWVVVRLLHKL